MKVESEINGNYECPDACLRRTLHYLLQHLQTYKQTNIDIIYKKTHNWGSDFFIFLFI